ncbi:uncharacterized protein OCT59_013661 [Rhizophagus irregularis]|uniref:uncharacterized protein n=1 Tax=Rhizophagus irregularis TaxID=588596 RepID=UPI001C17E22C|nr:hypothetical protein OCT59_013661 [Rhizophagus irregularis]CAB5204369.1 unnamed protein product [Rhizophagus irregularis]CAB5204370.1 unnamed protein product [Rhizophagus irregularis]
MLPDTLEGYCLTSPYQMAVRNSEVEYLAKANSLLLLFLQQIFRASTTSPVFKVIKVKVEQEKSPSHQMLINFPMLPTQRKIEKEKSHK